MQRSEMDLGKNRIRNMYQKAADSGCFLCYGGFKEMLKIICRERLAANIELEVDL